MISIGIRDYFKEIFKNKEFADQVKILKETDDPLSFFPWRRMIHFNKEGYALIGDTIIDNFLEK